MMMIYIYIYIYIQGDQRISSDFKIKYLNNKDQ